MTASRRQDALTLRSGYIVHPFFGIDFGTGAVVRLTDDPSSTEFDVLIEETDRRYVHFELDLFWSWRGATGPVDILRRTPPRTPAHALDTARVGYEYLANLSLRRRRR